MKEARRRFCDRYHDKTAEWWDSVIITDESTFRVQAKGNSGNFVRRIRGSNRYGKKVTARKYRICPGVSIWAGFSSDGRCDLVVLPRNEMMRSPR